MTVMGQLSAADVPVFRICGPLDVTSAADLRAELTDLLGGNYRADLVLDLSGVQQIDLVGLGLLVGVHRQAQRRGRRLVLSDVPPRVMRLLIATRLHRVLAIRDSTSIRIPEVRAG
jgi:anti-anti-sigma factor